MVLRDKFAIGSLVNQRYKSNRSAQITSLVASMLICLEESVTCLVPLPPTGSKKYNIRAPVSLANSSSSFLVSGSSCTCLPVQPLHDKERYYPEPSYRSAHLMKPKRECQKSSSELIAKRVEELFKEESSMMISDPFPGFLAIGTLGSEPIITEPTTPTFPTPFDNVTEKETEVTENELKLINSELERFLEVEAKEVGYESSERSSHASIITLNCKHIEGLGAEEHGNVVICPLQGYLFGSSIELPETSVVEVKKEKTSLGELFKRNNIAYEHSTGKCAGGENNAKGTHATQFMKKMLKRFHSSSRSCTDPASGGAADSVSTKRKLPKVGRLTLDLLKVTYQSGTH